MTQLHELITTVLVEQPLALPGSSAYCLQVFVIMSGSISSSGSLSFGAGRKEQLLFGENVQLWIYYINSKSNLLLHQAVCTKGKSI